MRVQINILVLQTDVTVDKEDRRNKLRAPDSLPGKTRSWNILLHGSLSVHPCTFVYLYYSD